jgi:hypothetical protein
LEEIWRRFPLGFLSMSRLALDFKFGQRKDHDGDLMEISAGVPPEFWIQFGQNLVTKKVPRFLLGLAD